MELISFMDLYKERKQEVTNQTNILSRFGPSSVFSDTSLLGSEGLACFATAVFAAAVQASVLIGSRVIAGRTTLANDCQPVARLAPMLLQ